MFNFFLFRMFCLLLSLLITDKLSLAPVTRPSNCGTLWPSASSPFKKMVTPIGYPAYVSPPITPIPSLFLAVGIAPLRSGIWPTASWRTTTTVTMATWTLLLYRPMVPSAPLVARTPRLSCGIWMMARTYTLWNTTTSSMPCASHPTVIGCALPTVHPSRSGIWPARKPSKNCVPILFPMAQRLINPNVCHWLGLLMVKLCLLVTPTTQSVYGRYLFQLTKQQRSLVLIHVLIYISLCI